VAGGGGAGSGSDNKEYAREGDTWLRKKNFGKSSEPKPVLLNDPKRRAEKAWNTGDIHKNRRNFPPQKPKSRHGAAPKKRGESH